MDKKKEKKSKRVWLYRFIAIVIIPLLFIGLIELGLWIGGFGYPAGITVPYDWNGKDAQCENFKFTWRFFPRAIAREPEPFIYLEKKPENTYRIFVMGGSAAQGVPDPAFSFSRFLEAMLRDAYPGVRFEIINTAITAVNSHVMYQVAKDCADHQPDMFIIYMGNNEVVGPFGAGTIFGKSSPSTGMIRTGLWIKNTRLGQLITGLMPGPKGKKQGQWRGLEMFLEKQVRHNDPGLAQIYPHYKKNLEDMIKIARDKNIDVVVSTVACNLKDSPPFASLHRKSLGETEKKEWERLYNLGNTAETAGNYAEALEHYTAAQKIDDHFADLHFRMGRCRWQLGQFVTAKKAYIKARELDTLRFRVDSRINDIIRGVAAKQKANQKGGKIFLVDAEKAFEKHSPNGTPGEELFFEHVHMNFKGNYVLASAMFLKIRNILPAWIKKKARECPEQNLIPMEQCGQLLAYTGWDRFNLNYDVLHNYIVNPPYSNQLYHKERVERMEAGLQEMSVNLSPESLRTSAQHYLNALTRTPDDWRLHEKFARLLFRDMRDYAGAVDQYRRVLEYLPHSYRGYAGLGFVMRLQGNLDEAIKLQLKAVELNPYKPDVRNNLAFTYQLNKQPDKAKEHYKKTMEIQPHFEGAYGNLALLLGEEKQYAEAEAVCRKGLEMNPRSRVLYHNLGYLEFKQGKKEEAIKHVRKALEIDPGSRQSRRFLERLLR